ncbi:MAG: Sec-independent protein translocase protein TatB [Burkholderiaceae bacterium]|nr:twin-arginine translocase subunit TatB [Burkholderiales bacterium LSUCC0115]NBT72964.1 twin-arginine translocase subunit TatB [Betaproteobacteria bacterium]
MLDIGFSELVLVAGVGLVVLGPKRLPVVTRTVGTLLGRAQRYVADVKNDIQRQMDVEELRKMQKSVNDLGQEIESGVNSMAKEVEGVTGSIGQGISDFEGSDADFASVYDKKAGYFLGAPDRSWTREQDDERLRDRVRNRMRKRYLTKRPRYD